MKSCGKKVGSIKSASDAPDCLLRVVEYLNTCELNICLEHADGRVGSIQDEDSCIDELRKCGEFNVISESDFDKFESDGKLCVVVPKVRDWYDIRVVYNEKSYYINIKSSTLKSADNVGCVDAIMYGLFGIIGNYKTKKDKYNALFKEYNKYKKIGFDEVEEYDYYFLVIDKNNNGNCFITSLCHMNKKSIRPNGSNLPFQCKWDLNSPEKYNKEEVCDLIINTIFNSLKKSADIFQEDGLVEYMKSKNDDFSNIFVNS